MKRILPYLHPYTDWLAPAMLELPAPLCIPVVVEILVPRHMMRHVRDAKIYMAMRISKRKYNAMEKAFESVLEPRLGNQ